MNRNPIPLQRYANDGNANATVMLSLHELVIKNSNQLPDIKSNIYWIVKNLKIINIFLQAVIMWFGMLLANYSFQN